MIVLDASAAVLGLLNDGDARRALMHEDVAIPHLADSQIAHALRAQELRGDLDYGEVLMAAVKVAIVGNLP